MQFKRIAAVAAAAVVGPMALMTTPAMADEQQPAVSVPDSAPKDDTAPGAETTPETTPETGPETEPAPETAPVTPPVAPPVAQPETPASAPVNPPPAGGEAADAKDAAPDSKLAGPDVTVAGIPKDGFKADGGWTPLTLTVNNSSNTEVTNYTPRIQFFHHGGQLDAAKVNIEYRVTDAAGNRSWVPAEFISIYDNDFYAFGFGTEASVAGGSVYTVDVRIGFDVGTAVVPFRLSAEGMSIREDGGMAWSPSTVYKTSIAGATADGDDIIPGPSLSLNGVPTEGFKAGGDWREIGIHADNAFKVSLKGFKLDLAVERVDLSQLKPEHVQVEFYGKNGWEPVKHSSADTGLVSFSLWHGPIAERGALDFKVRVRFAKDAPAGDIRLRPVGSADDDLGSGDHHVWVKSPSEAQLSKIVAADPAPVDTGNDPAPNGGSKPIVAPDTGTGGELATTGSDPATTWALGGAGVALAMGAALVAGTGRHRRRTTA